MKTSFGSAVLVCLLLAGCGAAAPFEPQSSDAAARQATTLRAAPAMARRAELASVGSTMLTSSRPMPLRAPSRGNVIAPRRH